MNTVIESLLHIINEGLKCFLVVWGIMGFSFKRLFISAIIRACVMGIIIISIGDLFVWSLLITLFPQLETMADLNANIMLDVVWFVVTLILYKRRKIINEYFLELSWGWCMLFILILFGIGLLMGSTQYVMYEEPTQELKKAVLIIQALIAVLMLFSCVILTYNIINRRKLKLLVEKEQEKYQLITEFYEKKRRQEEELRKFRHDMKHHMKIMHQIGRDISEGKGDLEKLQMYIDGYLKKYPEQKIVNTGHIVSDYFISELLEAMADNEEFTYIIDGMIPKELPVTDVDLSILLGNAISNAKEELIQIEGSCYFEFSVGVYNEKIMINIENTKAKNAVVKSKLEGHGYGLKNMREIVRGRSGKMKIVESEDRFCVKVSF